MWSQFLLENAHFGLNLFASLALFSVFWLYADAWSERKSLKDTLKIIGFLLLSVSFLLHATHIESPTITLTLLENGIIDKIALSLRLFGYILVFLGVILDKLLPKPALNSLLVFPSILYFPLPLASVLCAIAYLRRATKGLENHLKLVSLSFFLLSFHELTASYHLLSTLPHITLFNLFSPFGPIWLISHVLLAISSFILLRWSFSYLLKRINTQLFIISTTSIISIFLVTAISFTFLLFTNIKQETLTRLKTDIAVFDFALNSKTTETESLSAILSQDTNTVSALIQNSKLTLADLAENHLLKYRLQSVIIIDSQGIVLSRGEERDRTGDSLSDHPLVKKALLGQTASSLSTSENPVSPLIKLSSASPISSEGKIIGAVICSIQLDNTFLDGIKKQTDLEITLFGQDTVSSTTLISPQTQKRPLGLKMQNSELTQTSLIDGKIFEGEIRLQNSALFAVFSPLKSNQNEIIGLIMAGRPSVSVVSQASRSIELTFLITIALISLSLLPSYWLAKYITNQLK